ncbi:hypothetical protein [Microvirga splendida]|uniref:Uncharacterized protein n=1 Tax=Microvirga splendida TaxID=2795727 RepID=A0ABS0Y0T2_9HYPH|nr:hypothetical protein [Microvirga splendida]MBJ6125908.1 hypothetical protein [Microvirga splendida]
MKAARVCDPDGFHVPGRRILVASLTAYIVALIAPAEACHIAAALQRFAVPTGAGTVRLKHKGNAEQIADETGTKKPLAHSGCEYCLG